MCHLWIGVKTRFPRTGTFLSQTVGLPDWRVWEAGRHGGQALQGHLFGW